ncbi:Self-incomp_S1 domain-containing protein, partial [Cephalotus follicularis]
VTIHRKFKDNDDLGVHVLSHGSSYRWGFGVNVSKTTLFFCGFTSQYGERVYDNFKADRDTYRCIHCLWEVREDGVHDFIEKVTKDDICVQNTIQSNVIVHCKSKDDDLGVRVLSQGNYFGFTFNINLWRTTLFFCGFTSQYGRGVYDIVKARRDSHRCTHCSWEVREDGVYGFKENSTTADIWFKW